MSDKEQMKNLVQQYSEISGDTEAVDYSAVLDGKFPWTDDSSNSSGKNSFKIFNRRVSTSFGVSELLKVQ